MPLTRPPAIKERSLPKIRWVPSSSPSSLFSFVALLCSIKGPFLRPDHPPMRHLRGGGVKAGGRKWPPEGLGFDDAEHGAKIIAIEGSSRVEVWAAPPFGRVRSFARQSWSRDRAPTWPEAAGLIPPGRDRCRRNQEPDRTKPRIGTASGHARTVLGRSRRGLEAHELVSRQARRPALSRPCAPCCVTLYGRDGEQEDDCGKLLIGRGYLLRAGSSERA